MGKADIYSAARKRTDFRELVEDLLDVVLTTYNHHLIDPPEGERLAELYERRALGEREGFELLCELARRTEPQKFAELLRRRGLEV
jgi:cell fate regulator YaaT (PSP1 superfamily)